MALFEQKFVSQFGCTTHHLPRLRCNGESVLLTDNEGKYLIADGLSTVVALQHISAKVDSGMTTEDFCSELLEVVRSRGIYVDYVTHETDLGLTAEHTAMHDEAGADRSRSFGLKLSISNS